MEIKTPFTVGHRKEPKVEVSARKIEELLKKAIGNRSSQIFGFDNMNQNYGRVSRSHPHYKPRREHGSFVKFQNDMMTDSWGKLLDPRAYRRQINITTNHETERPVYGM